VAVGTIPQVSTPIEKQSAVSASIRTAGDSTYSKALTLLNFLASTYDRDFPPIICQQVSLEEKFRINNNTGPQKKVVCAGVLTIPCILNR